MVENNNTSANLHVGHRRRLRERLLAKPGALSDEELVELLLGYTYLRRDNAPLSRRLIQYFGTVRDFLAAPSGSLHRVEGCGEPVETLLVLLRELFARSHASTVKKRQALSMEEIVEMGKSRLILCPHEEVWAALLDKRNRLLNFIRVREGSASHIPLEPREVVELMFRENASSVVLLHNHPSGLSRPSVSDRDWTERLDATLQSLGMYLQDHIIISQSQAFSLRLDRILPPREDGFFVPARG